ncbi:hypothetical protein KUTeg_005630 [Tegillarca granosa]|uniref:RRM domain-containing protein n=1 Tax=Tegillarca granosa TaxID=220873 RepID=A0ABQ9FNJ1_TEGGR|nr:hypothetical protein KUTeg_005630 [Tegillarca granosa]
MGDYGLSVATGIGGFTTNNKNILQNNIIFSDSPSPHTMQDETLLDKSASKQAQQQLSSNNENGSGQTGEILSRNGKIECTLSDEKRTDSVINVSTPIQQFVTETNGTSVTSLSSAPTGYWSNAASDDTFIQGFQQVNGTVAFQQFPPTANNIYSASMTAHMGMNIPQQQQAPHRRAITGHHNFPRQQQPLNMMVNNNNSKTYPNWSNAHQQPQTNWSVQQSTLPTWTNVPQQRRSVPSMNPVTQMKRQSLNPQFSQSSLIAPSKFQRSTSFPGQMHQAALLNPKLDLTSLDDGSREAVSYQDRSSSYDSMRFSSFETQLLDIMRSSEQNDHIKGKSGFTFGDGNHILDDNTIDQNLASLGSITRRSLGSSQGERIERFSRKVFVGGLPPDIDEEEITAAFRRFGPLVVDWPHKAESKSYFPPKGYSFLLFQDEMSVQALIDACIVDDDKLYWCVSSPTMKDKPVQIRPWNLSDSDFVMDGSQALDPRKTIFVGGVPRPLRAVELAMIMDRLYGGVCYAGIDTDPELKYPKGAGRVAFSNQQSYIAAISARFVQLQHGEIDKRVEVKPYVLDDQMCDECQGARCGGKFAPFFCANVTCLQYYCEHCWAQIHSRPGREFHKPLVKEGADRPRAVPFRWC